MRHVLFAAACVYMIYIYHNLLHVPMDIQPLQGKTI